MKLIEALQAFFFGCFLYMFLFNVIADFVKIIEPLDAASAGICVAMCVALGVYTAYLWMKD